MSEVHLLLMTTYFRIYWWISDLLNPSFYVWRKHNRVCVRVRIHFLVIQFSFGKLWWRVGNEIPN